MVKKVYLRQSFYQRLEMFYEFFMIDYKIMGFKFAFKKSLKRIPDIFKNKKLGALFG